MRILVAGAMIVLLTMPASSEEKLTPMQSIQQQKKEDAAEVEKAYQKTLKSTRSNAPETKVDPWGDVRTLDPVPAKQKSPSKKSN